MNIFQPQQSKLTQRIRAQTDLSGDYNWVFPIYYNSGIVPIVSAVVEDDDMANSCIAKIISLNHTGVNIRIFETNDVVILGVHTLGLAPSPQAYVHLTAIEP